MKCQSFDEADVERKPGLEVRRVELLTRVATLDELIAEQARRTHMATYLGWDVRHLEEQLRLLKESRELHFSELKRLLQDSSEDDHP